MGLLSNTLDGALSSGPDLDMAEGCPDTITILRAGESQGSLGGTVYNWATTSTTTVASNIAANIQTVSAREVQLFARRGIRVTNKVYIPGGAATRLGDRIQNPNNAAQYFVVVFIADMGGEHLAFEVFVNLIQ